MDRWVDRFSYLYYRMITCVLCFRFLSWLASLDHCFSAILKAFHTASCCSFCSCNSFRRDEITVVVSLIRARRVLWSSWPVSLHRHSCACGWPWIVYIIWNHWDTYIYACIKIQDVTWSHSQVIRLQASRYDVLASAADVLMAPDFFLIELFGASQVRQRQGPKCEVEIHRKALLSWLDTLLLLWWWWQACMNWTRFQLPHPTISPEECSSYHSYIAPTCALQIASVHR